MPMDWRPATSEPDQLGESPFWHPVESRLYWVDIAGRALCRVHPASGRAERWAMPSEPGCIAPARTAGQPSGLVIALRDTLYRAKDWGGPLVPVARLPIDPATERANDGKCDALGRFWVGTMHEPAAGPRQPVAALYCVDGRGDGAPLVRRMLDGVATANGLAWSPDGGTLYWVDTPSHTIRAWACDASGEPVGAPRVLHAFAPKPDGWKPGQPGYGGRPDGAAVDAEGHYWCAMYEGGRVLRLSPGGEIVADIPVPAQCPTMPCLGGDGPEGATLFVTSARQGRPADELAREPHSGHLLVAGERLPVAGRPVNWYEEGPLPAGLA
ncbi:SMP-30/gluconolactonase/LRE family protein [Acidovorax sp. SUPP2539]|nr:SMP-30/gluconolactonase/LRE family protein [Acidovorax sp. SUPP2539]